jgi:hypothetical protein
MFVGRKDDPDAGDVSADPEYRARFNREADLAATLYHPVQTANPTAEVRRTLSPKPGNV